VQNNENNVMWLKIMIINGNENDDDENDINDNNDNNK